MQSEFQPTVYILASHRNGTLYTGVTSNLMARLYQHREELAEGFTKEKGVKRLVWFEVHDDMEAAIIREKRISIEISVAKSEIDRIPLHNNVLAEI